MTKLQEKAADAYRFVNERYVFNEHHYPILIKLNDEERKIFALKHAILHIQKSLCNLIDGAQKQANSQASDSGESQLTEALTKTLINILKIAEILKISAADLLPIHEFEKEFFPAFQDELQKRGEVLFSSLSALASECERADHLGTLDETAEKFRKNRVFDMYAELVSFTKGELSPISFEEALDFIPTFMRTKEISS